MALPAEKLLVFLVSQGWAPLFAFLEVPSKHSVTPPRPAGRLLGGSWRRALEGTVFVLWPTVRALVLLTMAEQQRLLRDGEHVEANNDGN